MIKGNCAFTICTRSYRGLAETLRDSFLKFNSGFDFYVIYVDADMEEFLEDSEYSAKEIVIQFLDENKYEEMSFKYDLTEFCTSIKPYVLKYFLHKGYGLAVYFDPDLFFFLRFKELYDTSKSAYVTPHIITPQRKHDIIEDTQADNWILRSGIYNCGFIAFRNCEKSLDVLDWWCEKLADSAFIDSWNGLFTDQKWIDFLPVFFTHEELSIIKNPGCNFAPWNYFERKIEKSSDGKYFVVGRNGKNFEKNQLCFYHASGYNYKDLANGEISHNYRNLNALSDMNALLLEYGKSLKEHDSEKYFAIPYRYGFFSDGSLIIKLHRRMYRYAVDNKKIFENPFSSTGKYFLFLKRKGLIFKTAVTQTSSANISGYERKAKMVGIFLDMFRKMLGGKRFIEFMAGLHKFTRDEEIAMYVGGKNGVMGAGGGVAVSVIIVNYNTRELTRNCLASVFAQTEGVGFEVIVSDNGSTDGSVEMIRREFPQVVLIENGANLGFGAANNRALRAARGKYILYLNSDTVLLNNAVRLFFDYFEENGGRENLGALGCRLQDENGNAVHSGGDFPTPGQSFLLFLRQLFSCYIYRFFPHKKKTEEIRNGEIDYITGADLFLLNNSDARFDERYFMYCEEVDLQKSLALRGKGRFLLDEPHIIHLGGASGKIRQANGYRFSTFNSINIWISNLKFLRKFYGNKGSVKILPYLITLAWNLPDNKKATEKYRKRRALFTD